MIDVLSRSFTVGHLPLRRLNGEVVGNALLRIDPEIGVDLLGRAEADREIVHDLLGLKVQVLRARPVDCEIKIGRVKLLLHMGIDNALYVRKPLLRFLCKLDIVRISALDLQVDLGWHAEIQNLRHHVGRLEIEEQAGERFRQPLAQRPDVILRGAVVLFQRDLDDAVIDADDRVVGEGEVIEPLRDADIVEDELAFRSRDDAANVVFDLLKILLRVFDACAGRSAHMKLDKPRVHGRERSRGQHNRTERPPSRRRRRRSRGTMKRWLMKPCSTQV